MAVRFHCFSAIFDVLFPSDTSFTPTSHKGHGKDHQQKKPAASMHGQRTTQQRRRPQQHYTRKEPNLTPAATGKRTRDAGTPVYIKIHKDTESYKKDPE
jgi:hypothetical protein